MDRQRPRSVSAAAILRSFSSSPPVLLQRFSAVPGPAGGDTAMSPSRQEEQPGSRAEHLEGGGAGDQDRASEAPAVLAVVAWPSCRRNADNCDGEVGQALEACQAGTAVGTGIGVALIIGPWVAVDIILSITYLIVRKR